MTELTDKLIERKQSFIFFQVRCIPIHPFVLSEFKRKQEIDFDVFNKSLDNALEWTYHDLRENPELERVPTFWGPFQTKERETTTDKEVIKQWLSEGEHEYFKIKKGLRFDGKDLASFPVEGTRYCDSGIYVGMTPIIITYDPAIIFKDSLRARKKRTLLPKRLLDEFGIEKIKEDYKIPAFWYTKDATPLVRLFGKNFAMCYTNEMIRKKYSSSAP